MLTKFSLTALRYVAAFPAGRASGFFSLKIAPVGGNHMLSRDLDCLTIPNNINFPDGRRDCYVIAVTLHNGPLFLVFSLNFKNVFEGPLKSTLDTLPRPLYIMSRGIFFWCFSSENAHRWIPPNTFDDKSTLVQVMDWCRQATSHYWSQYWPSSMASILTKDAFREVDWRMKWYHGIMLWIPVIFMVQISNVIIDTYVCGVTLCGGNLFQYGACKYPQPLGFSESRLLVVSRLKLSPPYW